MNRVLRTCGVICFSALVLLVKTPHRGANMTRNDGNDGTRSLPTGALVLADARTPIRVMALSGETSPVLKVLIPGQKESQRGIEIEFPEHVWGRTREKREAKQLYAITSRPSNGHTSAMPCAWRKQGRALVYSRELKHGVFLTARAELEQDGVRMRYRFVNHSDVDYEYFQAVTCVKLYDDFADTFLERTYVHHPEGFELLASETPERLRLPRDRWLPCRYLVSYTWPVVPKERRVETVEGILRYHKSRQVDQPFLATLSKEGEWIAATGTRDTGNLWTNPERTCHHADPATELKPGATREVELKLFLFRGSLDTLLERIKQERGRFVP